MQNKIPKCWYVIQVFSGFEIKIVEKLKEYIKINQMEHIFGEIIVPSEEIVSEEIVEKKNFFLDIL